MRIYDLQTEEVVGTDSEEVVVGTDGDISLGELEPRGNRGGIDNIERLLEDVDERHVRIEEAEDGCYVEPYGETSMIYVEEEPVGVRTRVENGATISLGNGRSDLSPRTGYRIMVFHED